MQNQEFFQRQLCNHQDSIEPISYFPLSSIDDDTISLCYCINCGIIIPSMNIGDIGYSKANNYLLIIKPSSMEKQCHINPLIHIETMKNHNKALINDRKTPSLWYINIRRKVTSYLQRLCLGLKYSDGIYYTALNYIDFLLKNTDQEIKGKTLETMIIACLVLAAKFSENDIYAPAFHQFEASNGKMLFTSKDILKAEMITIQRLDYDLIYHSTYDWLFIILYHGFIFLSDLLENNKKHPSDYINQIYCYGKKSLAIITPTNIFLEFQPLFIALAIIETTRLHFNMSMRNFHLIKGIYLSTTNNDNDNNDNVLYEKCLLEVQKVLLSPLQCNSNTRDYISCITKEDILRKSSHTITLSAGFNNELKSSTISSNYNINDFKIPYPTRNHIEAAVPIGIIIPSAVQSSTIPQERNKKPSKTVKLDCKLNIKAVSSITSTTTGLNSRRNSFINKVEYSHGLNGQIDPQSKLMTKPFCGSFIKPMCKSTCFNYGNNIWKTEASLSSVSYNKIKSSSQLPLSKQKNQNTVEGKRSHSKDKQVPYNKKSSRTTTKLPVFPLKK